MSMFNDIIWRHTDKWTDCIADSTLGRWLFFGLDQKRSAILLRKKDQEGKWDRVSELMMIKIRRRRTLSFPNNDSVVSRNAHEHRRWKIIHTLLPMDIRVNFSRKKNSVNQLRIYWEVSDLCEEYSICQICTGRFVVAEQSDPFFAPADLFIMTPTPSIGILAQEIYCRSTENAWKHFQNYIIWCRIVLMHDSWKQLKSDNDSWQNRLTSSYNCKVSDMSWVYVPTIRQIKSERLAWREHQNLIRVGGYNQLLTRGVDIWIWICEKRHFKFVG